MMTHLIRLRGRLLISEICGETDVKEQVLLEDLRRVLTNSYREFGVQAFGLEFDGRRGWSMISSSCVGILAGEVVTIVLESRIEGLTTEKLLAMAQLTGGSGYRISESTVLAGIQVDGEYSQTDLLGLSLVDSCIAIRRAGRHFTFVSEISRTVPLRGEIDIQESIQTGTLRPPVTRPDVQSFATPVNKFILGALSVARDKSRLAEARDVLDQELELWGADIPSTQSTSSSRPRTVTDLTLAYPRDDYRRALSLASAIHLDLSLDMLDGENRFREVLIDVDRLFEEFCQMSLLRLLASKIFTVSVQKEMQHPSTPQLRGFIKPDMVVTNTKTRKTLVLDLKNKYSQIEPGSEPSLSNPDVFQISYYTLALDCQYAFLVYPAVGTKLSFPIKKSESKRSYEQKIAEFHRSRSKSEPLLALGKNKIRLVPYQVEMGGSLFSTEESLATLATYIDHVLS